MHRPPSPRRHHPHHFADLWIYNQIKMKVWQIHLVKLHPITVKTLQSTRLAETQNFNFSKLYHVLFQFPGSGIITKLNYLKLGPSLGLPTSSSKSLKSATCRFRVTKAWNGKEIRSQAASKKTWVIPWKVLKDNSYFFKKSFNTK